MTLTTSDRELMQTTIDLAVTRATAQFSDTLHTQMGQLYEHVGGAIASELTKHQNGCPVRSDLMAFRASASSAVRTSGMWLRAIKWVVAFCGGGAVGAGLVKVLLH